MLFRSEGAVLITCEDAGIRQRRNSVVVPHVAFHITVRIRLHPVVASALIGEHAEEDSGHFRAGDIVLRFYRPEALVIRSFSGAVILRIADDVSEVIVCVEFRRIFRIRRRRTAATSTAGRSRIIGICQCKSDIFTVFTYIFLCFTFLIFYTLFFYLIIVRLLLSIFINI